MNTLLPILQKKVMTAVVTAAALVSGCGAGDSSSLDLSGGRGGVVNGMLSLKITDAPVDGARAVWVRFSGVTLKPKDMDPFQVVFDAPRDINLLALQGDLTDDLFVDVVVPAGEYNWVRLDVETAGVLDTYIVFDDGTVDGDRRELTIPSGAETGLKLSNGLTVLANGNSNKVIDFDLRKSVVAANPTDYYLKPVLRMADQSSGTLSGVIASSLLTDPAMCSDADPNTGNVVYVFEGANVVPDDIDGRASEPLTSGNVVFNAGSGEYEYKIGFLPYGDYTVAFSCNADLDQPESDDPVMFFPSSNITVSAGNNIVDVVR
ncbi:MAG: DUF4382 domain-containing protein [Gammaproteobacteria bacterium]|nr:DUF4382 domain-containing protein [Gammaproteobacteria bacterium]